MQTGKLALVKPASPNGVGYMDACSEQMLTFGKRTIRGSDVIGSMALPTRFSWD